MDNFQIEKCARADPRYLGRVFAGCLLTDDVNRLLRSSVNGLRLFLANTLLHRGLEHFPIAFVLNTGTHKNGGTHWQAVYFDHEHRAYFFDSYGRVPRPEFCRFIDVMVAFSYLRQTHRHTPLRQLLSDDTFTEQAVARAKRQQSQTVDHHTYFPYQIQNDASNVCGEYSVLFLYNITRCRLPWRDAYVYWRQFYLVPTISSSGDSCPCCRQSPNAARSHGQTLTRRQQAELLRNDKEIRTIFYNIFQFYIGNVLS